MSENTTKYSDSVYKKTLLQEYEESLNDFGDVLPKNAEEILNTLLEDDEFNLDLEALLDTLIEKGGLDIVEAQSKFILLIKEAIKRLAKAKKLDKEYDKEHSTDLTEDLSLIAHHILMRKSIHAKEQMEGLDHPKDHNHHITKASRVYMKQILKRFAIYEVYKRLNPRRIAGETRRDNFVHNMITGGIKRAMQYEGGTKKELESYSPSFIRSLEKQHQKFQKSTGRLM